MGNSKKKKGKKKREAIGIHRSLLQQFLTYKLILITIQ